MAEGKAMEQIPPMINSVIPELNCSKSCPVIVTSDNNGYCLTVVDFNDLSSETKEVQHGLNLIVKGIYEKSRQILMPEPISPYTIDLKRGEYIAVATINL